MSIQIVRLSTGTNAVFIQDEDLAHFKEMVNRACNCWDKAPPVIKEFADKITTGQVLQDYYNITQPRPRPDQ